MKNKKEGRFYLTTVRRFLLPLQDRHVKATCRKTSSLKFSKGTSSFSHFSCPSSSSSFSSPLVLSPRSSSPSASPSPSSLFLSSSSSSSSPPLSFLPSLLSPSHRHTSLSSFSSYSSPFSPPHSFLFSSSFSFRCFSITSRIHYLNSKTRYQALLHPSDISPSFFLLPLPLPPHAVLSYHHRFRTRKSKKASRFHPSPLPLPSPPVSSSTQSRHGASYMYTNLPLTPSQLALASGQQVMSPEVLEDLRSSFDCFHFSQQGDTTQKTLFPSTQGEKSGEKGEAKKSNCGGLGTSGESHLLSSLPPPRFVPARYLEDVAKKALQIFQEEEHEKHFSSSLLLRRKAFSGEESSSSFVTPRSSEEIYWRELENRVKELRDVLPIETLVRILTILTIRGKSVSIHPVSQTYKVFDPLSLSSSLPLVEEEEEGEGDGNASRKLSWLYEYERYTKDERLPCIRPLSPELLLCCLREVLEDFHLLSPPAVAALLATYAGSACTSSALVYTCIETWRLPRERKDKKTNEGGLEGGGEETGGRSPSSGVHTPEEMEGEHVEENSQEEKKKTSNEREKEDDGQEEEVALVVAPKGGEKDAFVEGKEVKEKEKKRRKRKDLREFSPADFSLFISSLSFLLEQQDLVHTKLSLQRKHLDDGVDVMKNEHSSSSSLSFLRKERDREFSMGSRPGSLCPPDFFHDCCIYTRENVESFSLFSFVSALTALTSEGFFPLPRLFMSESESERSLDEHISLHQTQRKRHEVSSGVCTPHVVGDETDPERHVKRRDNFISTRHKAGVLHLIEAIDLFIKKRREEHVKTLRDKRYLVRNLFELLQLSQLLLATCRCQVYIHLTSPQWDNQAQHFHSGLSTSLSQEASRDSRKAFLNGQEKDLIHLQKGEEASLYLLSYLTEGISTLHDHLEGLPRSSLPSTDRPHGDRKGEKEEDKEEEEEERDKEKGEKEKRKKRRAHDETKKESEEESLPSLSTFSYTPMSPGLMYLRNLFLNTVGIVGYSSLLSLKQFSQ
ncbi:hypothetical protein CSUI_010040, partial [Cystoisospora suis]